MEWPCILRYPRATCSILWDATEGKNRRVRTPPLKLVSYRKPFLGLTAQKKKKRINRAHALQRVHQSWTTTKNSRLSMGPSISKIFSLSAAHQLPLQKWNLKLNYDYLFNYDSYFFHLNFTSTRNLILLYVSIRILRQ